MHTRLSSVVAVVVLCVSLFAQKPAWQPAPGHLTLDLWPDGAPGASANSAPEIDTTSAKDNLIAGKPLIRLGNVSTPTLTVYALKQKNTGAAISFSQEAGTTFSLSISKARRSANGSTLLASHAFW
jgi:hypothetical protein